MLLLLLLLRPRPSPPRGRVLVAVPLTVPSEAMSASTMATLCGTISSTRDACRRCCCCCCDAMRTVRTRECRNGGVGERRRRLLSGGGGVHHGQWRGHTSDDMSALLLTHALRRTVSRHASPTCAIPSCPFRGCARDNWFPPYHYHPSHITRRPTR